MSLFIKVAWRVVVARIFNLKLAATTDFDDEVSFCFVTETEKSRTGKRHNNLLQLNDDLSVTASVHYIDSWYPLYPDEWVIAVHAAIPDEES